MNWNWREEFSKKNLLKTAGYIILLIVLWIAVQDVKSQMDTYCLQKYRGCICGDLIIGEPNFTKPLLESDGTSEGINISIPIIS